MLPERFWKPPTLSEIVFLRNEFKIGQGRLIFYCEKSQSYFKKFSRLLAYYLRPAMPPGKYCA